MNASKEPLLIFETDPKLGTPRLQSINGAAKTWGLKDLGPLEDLLRPRYEGLVRDGNGVIEFRGQNLQVKRKEGDASRQPTLELRLEEQPPARPALPMVSAPAPVASPLPLPSKRWEAGFLEEIDKLFAAPAFEEVLPAEKAMLRLVRDELRTLVERKLSAQFAQLLLVSFLATGEHVNRTQHPSEPQPYSFALSGLERLLNLSKFPSPLPWGELPVGLNPRPLPFGFGNLWKRLTARW